MFGKLFNKNKGEKKKEPETNIEQTIIMLDKGIHNLELKIGNLDEKFKAPIKEDIKKIIENKMKIIKENKVINSNEDEKWNLFNLSVALRRYISRYLVGNNIVENLENNNLISELNKSDLWGVNLRKTNEINKCIQILNDINILVGESYSFYEIIGEQDKELISFSKKKNNISEEEEEEESEENESEENS